MEQKDICHTVKQIAWGYVLIHLHFKIGALDLLPDWLGYFLFFTALPSLATYVPSALLLKPFGILLTVWEVVFWILSLFGISSFGYLPSILISIVALYFHFQLLTNLAELAKQQNCPQQQNILLLRTIRTIVSTLFILPFPWNDYEILTILILIVQIILTIWLCCVLFSFAKSLRLLDDTQN